MSLADLQEMALTLVAAFAIAYAVLFALNRALGWWERRR